jgi:hypothetical protein
MEEQSTCGICEKVVDSFELRKCPICHKLVCEECAYTAGGIYFCGKFCSASFFFGDGTGEDE